MMQMYIYSLSLSLTMQVSLRMQRLSAKIFLSIQLAAKAQVSL